MKLIMIHLCFFLICLLFFLIGLSTSMHVIDDVVTRSHVSHARTQHSFVRVSNRGTIISWDFLWTGDEDIRVCPQIVGVLTEKNYLPFGFYKPTYAHAHTQIHKSSC